MSKEERYDIVIAGGGFNGITTAAYLAKCGLSVCVLEERPECGGGVENTEPIPGVRISPHAILMYAAPAPGFEQLELWKYGFRMDWSPALKDPSAAARGVMTTEGLKPISDKDKMGWAKISGLLTNPPFIKDLLRATFWCPPHPPEIELTKDNVPYMQVYKKNQPDMWTDELMEMTMFDLMDEYLETEHFKTLQAYVAWYSGAAGHYEGAAIPALGCDITLTIYGGTSSPRGGMHGYFHSVMRCALAHGAVIRTCCPVQEIIISDGRAQGVRVVDQAAMSEKVIWANKAVISDIDVKQTWLKLVGPKHLDAGFIQKVKDISVKGGSIYCSHILTREPLDYVEKYKDWPQHPAGGVYPMDSREIYFEHVADVDGHRGKPIMPPERVPWIGVSSYRFNPSHSDCTRPNQYLTSPFYCYVPPPEYLVDGPDSIDRDKKEVDAYMIKAFSQVIRNLNSDNIIHHWTNTPYESEFRNTGMIGGTWCGTRHDKDQLFTNRPFPELSRYRSPIEGLYHCHQTAAHPGGLALMATTYNMMHILIEDGIAEPGKWWYPSPWYIPQQGKISAIPR